MSRGPVYRIYEDAAGEWRWRLVAGNGETIADSAESYTRKGDAERAVQTAAHAAAVATLDVVR